MSGQSQWECIAQQSKNLKKLPAIKVEYSKWLKTLKGAEKKACTDYPLWGFYTDKTGKEIRRIMQFTTHEGFPIMRSISVHFRGVSLDMPGIPLWDLRQVDKWDEASIMMISGCGETESFLSPTGYKDLWDSVKKEYKDSSL